MDRRQHPKARKRGHGEGSMYQRPDGRWVGTIMLGLKPDGKPDRPKVYGRTALRFRSSCVNCAGVRSWVSV